MDDKGQETLHVYRKVMESIGEFTGEESFWKTLLGKIFTLRKSVVLGDGEDME